MSIDSLERDGFAVSKQMFNRSDIKSFNNLAGKLPPLIGMSQDGVWIDRVEGDVDWAYNWAQVPEDNSFINDTVLPALGKIADSVFQDDSWGWQLTNRYVVSNYHHEFEPSPHLDAPYLWPQNLQVQMAKYLPKGILSITFMVPLVEFTPTNGATAYLPGTHKYLIDTTNWQEAKLTYRELFQDNYVQPSVPLGSISMLYGNCLHAIMPNKTNSVRRALIYRAIRQDALSEMDRLGLG